MIKYRNICSYCCFMTSVDISFVVFLLIFLENNFASHFETIYHIIYDFKQKIYCVMISVTHIYLKFTCKSCKSLYFFPFFSYQLFQKIGLRMSNYNDKTNCISNDESYSYNKIIILVKQSSGRWRNLNCWYRSCIE